MPRLVVLAVSLLVISSGAMLAGCGSRPAEPAALVPFRAFEITEGGGVAGRQNTLAVAADGVALRISTEPAAGRIGRPTIDRLRTLLESEEFRQEVTAAAQDDQPPTCTDMFNASVTMGSLTMRVEDPCDDARQPATPAFDEILTLTAAARQGRFEALVGTEEPRLPGLRFERLRTSDQAQYVITVNADGKGTLAREGSVRRRETLATADRDALRLLVARLVQTPVTDCQTTVQYRLTITGFPRSSGPDCGYQDHQREFSALNALLQTVFAV